MDLAWRRQLLEESTRGKGGVEAGLFDAFVVFLLLGPQCYSVRIPLCIKAFARKFRVRQGFCLQLDAYK